MSDRIKFRCDCGKKLNAPTVSAGKRCKCTGCGREMRIPLPAQPRGAPPQIGIRTAPPAAAQAPVPEGFDFELELVDLEEIQPSAPTRPTATKPPPPTALAANSRSDAVPQGIPIPTPAAGKSIWEEESEYALTAPAQDVACPKCGTSMQSSARVCLACGYNRATGAQAAGAPLAPIVSKKKKKRSSSIGFGGLRGIANAFLSRWVLIPLVIGITFLGVGFKEQKLADISSAEPEPISLARLLERGPNGNPNLILSDFEICENWILYEKKAMVGVAVGEWTKVWVPIVPTSNANRAGAAFANFQDPQDIRTLILSSRVHNENEVVPTLAVKQLSGMVINQIAALSSKEKDLLRQGYPGVNFDNVIIFEENRQPASSEKIGWLLAGGGLLVVVGIGIAVKKILMA
jgi:ribosomal protein L32